MKPKKPIESLILNVRGQKVILDADLAALYDVPVKRLNEQVKRNSDRFPEDFAFQLSEQEWAVLRSQFATLKTGSGRHRKYLPYAFTEHGALMAANILHSKQAVEMSVFVIRAFVSIREHLVANAAILKRLAEIDRSLLEHDSALSVIWDKLQPLLEPPPEPPPRRIKGFNPDKE